MMNMKPLHSILTLNSILALAGNVIAAPVPDYYEPAHKTTTIWLTYTHTKVVPATKTEWVYPPTDGSTPSSASYYSGSSSYSGYSSYSSYSGYSGYSDYSDYSTIYPSSTDPAVITSTPSITAYSTPETASNVVYMTTSTTITTTDLKVQIETYASETPTPEPYPSAIKSPHIDTKPLSVYTPPVYTPPVYTPPVYTPPHTSTPSPEPQPTIKPETTKPQDTYPDTGSSDLTGSWTGDATYYDVGLGSCGVNSVSSEHIVALWHGIMEQYDNGNPNNNPLCGKYITCEYDGKTVSAKVVDTCPGCVSFSLSISACSIANPLIGRRECRPLKISIPGAC